MRMISTILVLTLLAIAGAFSQFRTDFLISRENVPSTIRQRDARLFPRADGRFLAAWSDERSGEASSYAQWFDAVGKPLGRNFPFTSNQIVEFAVGGSFLSINGHIEGTSIFWDYTLFVQGTFYDSSGRVIESRLLAQASLPWCGTGYLGVDYDCAATKSGFVFLFRDNGVMSLHKYDHQGAYVREIPLGNLQYGSLCASIASLPSGDYMVSWVETGGDDRAVELGTFFDSNDSAVVQRKVLGFPVDSTEGDYSWYSRSLKVVPLADSSYRVFSWDLGADSISSLKFNPGGERLGDIGQLPLPHDQDAHSSIDNFAVSTAYNDTFNVLITTTEWNDTRQWENRKTLNTMYSFTSDGEFTGEFSSDSTSTLAIGGRFVRMPGGIFLFGSANDSDVYLTTLENLIPSYTLRLNDDVAGSNEVTPYVAAVDNRHFFVSWRDEVKWSGAIVNIAGEIVREPIILEDPKCEFFQDWSFVNTWKRILPWGERVFGFTLHDASWNVVLRDTMEAEHGAVAVVSKILTDSTFVIAWSGGSDRVRLAVYDRKGLAVARTEFDAGGYVGNLTIDIRDIHSFWIRFSGKARLFSSALDPLSDLTVLPAAFHLGGEKFLCIDDGYYDWQYRRPVFGTIVSASGDTLVRKFPLVNNIDEITYSNVTPNSFAILCRRGDEVFVRMFSHNGVSLGDSLPVHALEPRRRKDAALAVTGENIFVSWAEARTPPDGFSIYGTVIDPDLLVGVEEVHNPGPPLSFSIAQNYPNPFNPTTTLSFAIAQRAVVSVVVYNALGEEMARVIEREIMEPGNYHVLFDGSHLSSGVYFYRLVADQLSARVGAAPERFVSTGKMTLVK